MAQRRAISVHECRSSSPCTQLGKLRCFKHKKTKRPSKCRTLDAKNVRDLLTLQIPCEYCEYHDIFIITVTRREKFVSRRELVIPALYNMIIAEQHRVRACAQRQIVSHPAITHCGDSLRSESINNDFAASNMRLCSLTRFAFSRLGRTRGPISASA